jgi:lantibiotic modifying enzyme
MSSDELLGAAAALGRRLVAEAVWYDGRCSWLGAVDDPEDGSRPEYRPVGPSVYGGTAGIGLFLAELAAATGDAPARRAAIGALGHAVARAASLPRHGLQAGLPGVAWAAARTGALLDVEALAVAARALIADAAAASVGLPGPDVVMGAAGTVAALLGLAGTLREPACVTSAVAIGEPLRAAARVRRGRWSWGDPARPRAPHLCGLAHGASGIGAALAELFAATGDERFAAAARGAFAYERFRFDAESGLWPDLRTPPRVGRGAMRATWCYGEAGIAISRLRASRVLDDERLCLDADIAVATTRTHVQQALDYAIDDLSLCHGLGGAADALIEAGEHDAARALAHVAIDRFSRHGDWPCGVYGTAPGLLRGLSGIGWLFLRAHDPRVDSPLALPRAG